MEGLSVISHCGSFELSVMFFWVGERSQVFWEIATAPLQAM